MLALQQRAGVYFKGFCDVQDGSGTEKRIGSLVQRLQQLVYEYVCRSLFKADRLMFAMHLVHGMKPELFGENVSHLSSA